MARKKSVNRKSEAEVITIENLQKLGFKVTEDFESMGLSDEGSLQLQPRYGCAIDYDPDLEEFSLKTEEYETFELDFSSISELKKFISHFKNPKQNILNANLN